MRRVGFIGTVVPITVAILLLTAGTAGATWVQAPTPTITGERASSFSGVACPGAHLCIAVGGYIDSTSKTRLLAEQWDGTTWTTLPTSEPFNAASSGLDAVSCASTMSCVAVGSYVDSGGNTLPLADVWDGSTWTLWGPSLPANAVGGVLNAVKCRNPTRCTAVGSSTDAGNVTSALAERWDATSWKVEPTSTPTGSTESILNGIACVAGSQCIAVGEYRDATNAQLTLAETWNGTTWSIQSTPNPTGSTSNELNGISCSAPTACTAAGSGFAERWNGSSWALQTIVTPHPHTGGPPVLLGVACASATRCAAVGFYERDAVETLVAEIWNGKGWLLQSTSIASPNDSSVLAAVACKTPDSCMAAGSFHNSFFSQNHTLAEPFSIIWQQENFTSPGPSIAGSIDGVSCPTIKFCAAVGSFESATDFETYAETWDGFEWTVTAVPDPSTTNLSAVSCVSATACTAVGNGGNAGTGFVTLAERWNGTTWTAQTTPNQSGAAGGTYFTSVSCPSMTSCTAVGAYRTTGGKQFPFAATWNGTTWVAHTPPNPTGATISQLNRVSCTRATSCVAVGSQGPSSPTALAEVWNGTTWTIHDPTFGAGLTDASFSGVSCQSPTSCTAVGAIFSNPAKRQFALAEHWDGTNWTDEGALVRPGTKFNSLNDVSCVASDNCMAVGSTVQSSSVGVTLTETWNGSHWTLHSAPNPGGTLHTIFTGVSCPSDLLCIGTGYFSDTGGNDTFLVEQYS